MAIAEQKDSRTRKTFLEANGTVTGVYYNELKDIKSYPGKQAGQVWTPTHRVTLVVDQDRIQMGLFEKTEKRPEIRCKDADDNYHTLAVGAQVSIVITEGEPYNGKPQYQAKSGDVLILKPAPEKAAAPTGGNSGGGFQKKNMIGVKVGHSINVAFAFLGEDDTDTLIETAKKAHALTEKLAAEHKAANPELSDYDIGASVGQAVLSAAAISSDFKTLEAVARATLTIVAPAVREFIEESQNAPEPSKKATTPAKKSVRKNVKQADPEPADEPESGFDDMDDAPF